jgi:Lrp/AsnC family transcriptional regulator, leucine-responsive regulatory protein
VALPAEAIATALSGGIRGIFTYAGHARANSVRGARFALRFWARMKQSLARPPVSKPSRPKIDDYDRAILRILQRDTKTPQRAIGEAVHLSAAAVQRRIAAMEASGVILSNVATIDPAAVDPAITVVVEVHLENDRSPIVDAAKALFRATPEVQQCYYVTGGAGFILIILVPSMPSYEALARRLFSDNETVLTFRTLVVLDRVKTDMAIAV